MTITGLIKSLSDKATQTDVAYHVVAGYQVSRAQKRTTAILASYAKQGATKPITTTSVTIPAEPDSEPVQWIYQKLLTTDAEANLLFGAEAVTEAANG